MLFISSSRPLLIYCCDANKKSENDEMELVTATATTIGNSDEKIAKIIDQTKSI